MSIAALPPAACGDAPRDPATDPRLDELSPQQLLGLAAAAPTSEDDPLVGVGQLAAIDRLTCWLAARKLSVVAGHVPFTDPDDASWCERHSFFEELQLACRIGEGTARRLADTALLASPSGPFAAMHAALEAGSVFEGHLRMLVAGTTNVVDDPSPVDPAVGPGRSREDKLTDICTRVLGRAMVETVGKFVDTVAAAVCAVDAEAEAARRKAAQDTRDVFLGRADADGMGTLITRNSGHQLAGVKRELDRRARALQLARGGASAARTDPDARIGACRADALTAAILGTKAPDSPEPAARPVIAHLVVDLATLRREADHPCTLDGVPIPAETGRDLAATAAAWRRMVTDPVTGHLLDYGRLTYLPEPLTKFIRARDGICAAPYCTRPATRCQVDHRLPWQRRGCSSSINCGLFCDRHHPLKTEGHIHVSNSAADGSFDYATAWGQSLHVPPRPYLDDPGRYQLDRHRPGQDEPEEDAASPPGTDTHAPPSLRLVTDADSQPASPHDEPDTDTDPPF